MRLVYVLNMSSSLNKDIIIIIIIIKTLLNRTSCFGPATLKTLAVRTFEKHFLSVMSGVGSARVILSVCLSVSPASCTLLQNRY